MQEFILRPGLPFKASLRKLRSEFQIIERLSKASRANFAWAFHLFRVEGARIKGQDALAWSEYQKANELAVEFGYLSSQAVAYERLGRFALGSGDQIGAMAFLKAARNLYFDRGAKLFCRVDASQINGFKA